MLWEKHKSRLESPSFRKLLRGLNRKCTSRSIFILVSVHSLWPSGTLCIYTTHDTTTKAESVIKKDLSQHSLSILCCSQSKEHYDFLLMSARKNSTNFNSVKNKVFLFQNTCSSIQVIRDKKFLVRLARLITLYMFFITRQLACIK